MISSTMIVGVVDASPDEKGSWKMLGAGDDVFYDYVAGSGNNVLYDDVSGAGDDIFHHDVGHYFPGRE